MHGAYISMCWFFIPVELTGVQYLHTSQGAFRTPWCLRETNPERPNLHDAARWLTAQLWEAERNMVRILFSAT